MVIIQQLESGNSGIIQNDNWTSLIKGQYKDLDWVKETNKRGLRKFHTAFQLKARVQGSQGEAIAQRKAETDGK